MGFPILFQVGTLQVCGGVFDACLRAVTDGPCEN
jgi:hypothetical protein